MQLYYMEHCTVDVAIEETLFMDIFRCKSFVACYATLARPIPFDQTEEK